MHFKLSDEELLNRARELVNKFYENKMEGPLTATEQEIQCRHAFDALKSVQDYLFNKLTQCPKEELEWKIVQDDFYCRSKA